MNQDEFDYDPAIRNRQIENLIKDIGRRIKTAMPPGYGFALQIFAPPSSPSPSATSAPIPMPSSTPR